MSGFTPPWLAEKFTDASGKPLSGGLVYFYIAGSTSIPKNIFLDYALTLPVSQPLVLGSDGGAEQYFMESGLYKVLWTDQFGANTQTRDNISGQGDGVSQYQVLTTAGDTTPDYLENKLAGSTTISWATYTTGGGSILMMPSVNIDAVLDHKVLSNGLVGDSAGYLDAKLTDLIGSTFAVNGSFQVVLPFQSYAALAGTNDFTGNNTFDGFATFNKNITTDGIVASGNIYAPLVQATSIIATGNAQLQTATVANQFQWDPAIGTGGVSWFNSAGQMQVSTGSPFMVSYNGTDTPQYIGTMLQGGTGVTITPTTVGGLTYMSFSVNTSGLTPSQPATQIVIGTGTGLGSSSNLISHGTDLVATGNITSSSAASLTGSIIGGAAAIGTYNGTLTTGAAWFGISNNNTTGSSNLQGVAVGSTSTYIGATTFTYLQAGGNNILTVSASGVSYAGLLKAAPTTIIASGTYDITIQTNIIELGAASVILNVPNTTRAVGTEFSILTGAYAGSLTWSSPVNIYYAGSLLISPFTIPSGGMYKLICINSTQYFWGALA